MKMLKRVEYIDIKSTDHDAPKATEGVFLYSYGLCAFSTIILA